MGLESFQGLACPMLGLVSTKGRRSAPQTKRVMEGRREAN